MTGSQVPQPAEWHIITCEYPPSIGGVSDYTFTLASALAVVGPVHVWCPVSDGPAPVARNVVVHAELRSFSRRELRRLGQRLDACQYPRKLFVQWVPQGYGYRSVNLGFAMWLAGRARRQRDQLHLMVHEPFLPWSVKPLHLGASLLHRAMLVTASANATRVWLSTQTWRDYVRPYVPSRTPVEWLPVPAPPVAVELTFAGLSTDAPAPNPTPSVGHFGTHSSLVTRMLEPALDVLLERTRATVLLIGRDSDTFRDRFVRARPHAATRVQATGVLTLEAAAQAMRRCDVMVQPYPDGVTARRTSTLAPLSLGVPVVTNAGHLTEDFWRDCGAVLLAPSADGRLIGESAAALLTDSAGRASLAVRAQDFYDRRFAPRHAAAMLTAAAWPPRHAA
ncbi:MAG: hypothetical protein ABMA15_00130 [Vicinamibacterales bacterium]